MCNQKRWEVSVLWLFYTVRSTFYANQIVKACFSQIIALYLQHNYKLKNFEYGKSE
jgi:hypothetical protein